MTAVGATNLEAGVLAASLSVALVSLEAWLACRDNMLTARQMKKKYPQHKIGLPFQWHLGMWGDIIIVTPLLGYLVAAYGSKWALDESLGMFVAGGAMSAIFHLHFASTPFPDSLVWKETISKAGVVHAFYTAAVLAVLGLTFYATESISPGELVLVSVVVAIHVTLASKISLGLLNRHFLRFEWCPELHHKRDEWIGVSAIYASIAALAFLAIQLQAAR